jgi:hypothetical protein
MDIEYKEETYEYYRAKKIKSNKWRQSDEENYKMESDNKIPFKRIEPLLEISLSDRRDMDRGDKAVTYEYYRAKKIKSNTWRQSDEENYKMESDNKIPFKRIEPLLEISLSDRRDMDRGDKAVTYEYYRAKQIKNSKQFLVEEDWKKLKEDEQKQPTEVVSEN